MNPDLDTLATRLYVTIDDILIEHPQWAPERPAVEIAPKLSDAELLTLAVLQALLGFTPTCPAHGCRSTALERQQLVFSRPGPMKHGERYPNR